MQQYPAITRDALTIWRAGIDAVRGDNAVAANVRWDANELAIGDLQFSLQPDSEIIIVGAGKATLSMLTGFKASLQGTPLGNRIRGWINVPNQTSAISRNDQVVVHQCRPLGINLPTRAAVEGTQRILRLVKFARPQDLIVCLLSGGGSSLLVDPIAGITLEDKIEITRQLSSAGVNIQQLNCVRRALSNVKAGGLARACNRESSVVTLVISDVLNDDLSTIASGPMYCETAVDISEVESILTKFVKSQSLIQKAMAGLRITDRSIDQRTSEHIIIANNAVAVDAAGCKAVELGYRYIMQCHRHSEGSACEVGKDMVHQLEQFQQQPERDCYIAGGEPTVDMRSTSDVGLGGRNQHVILCALEKLLAAPRRIGSTEFCLLSGGTDGEDGNSSMAGAWIDHAALARIQATGLDVAAAKATFNSGELFESLGTSINSGLTQTNVCDLRITLLKRK